MEIPDANRAGETPLALETVFDILAEPRRRYLLYYLRDRDRPVPLDELRRNLGERMTTNRSSDEARTNQVLDELRHEDLPSLVEVGVVDYDRELDLVRLRANVRPLDEYLHLAEQHDSVAP